MVQNLVIANFRTGFENDIEPFLLNNDAFPVLNNAYFFRGRILRKRGSTLLGRFQRDFIDETITGGSLASPWTIDLKTVFSLEGDSQIVEGTVIITIQAGPDIVFTDQGDGTLTSPTPGNSGTINYSTGIVILTHTAGVGVATIITYSYYPCLPAMGLEDFQQGANFPDLVGFDTKYSYEINTTTKKFYDVTFFAFTAIPFVWHGQDFQQFASTSYHNSLWATNGTPGFHFIFIQNVVYAAGKITITTTGNHNLTLNDRVFINEVQGIQNINGYSAKVTGLPAGNMFEIPDPGLTGIYGGGGIVQYLTRESAANDGIKYYIGDPIASSNFGWVNFAPPLDNTTIAPQYLIGADLIVPFKDRLLFFGVTIATSAAPAGQYYPNRMVYSQNGTPYYHLIIPDTETYQFQSWFQNVPARGGFLGAPVQQDIVTINAQEDLIFVGFDSSERKIIYTGDDSFPFIYQTIDAEMGSEHSFSAISLQNSVVSIGLQGFIITTSTEVKNIDLKIPDDVYQISFQNNDQQRVTAVRDFRNKFVYFTVPLDSRKHSTFPSKTFLFNYNENNWATLDENYTTYGYYRDPNPMTWATLPFKTWSEWTKPWNFQTGDRYPNIIGGNQQGFVLIKDTNIPEDNSNYIQAVSGTTVTSPNHCMNAGDYIDISGIIGTSGADLNNTIQQIQDIIDTDNFTIETTTSGTYLGGGVFKRIPNFDIRTKMFPVFWDQGKKVRLGIQRYLVENAPNGQVTVDLYASQVTIFPFNPQIAGFSPYSNILLTGPEPNVILNIAQNQIWHRISTPVIGDSVQVGFRLSDDQMRDRDINDTEFILHAIAIELFPAGVL